MRNIKLIIVLIVVLFFVFLIFIFCNYLIKSEYTNEKRSENKTNSNPIANTSTEDKTLISQTEKDKETPIFIGRKRIKVYK